jgi:S-disulfanyl-L-cysteine oxidoreductase SoxD
MKIALIASSLLFFACGGSAPPPAEPSAPQPAPPAAPTVDASAPAADGAPAPAPTPSPAADAFAEQAKVGGALYATHCASCHGPNGNDGKAPPVVGLKQGALPLEPSKKSKMRKTPFKTVADVADFVVKTMPPKAPGSLSADEYYAILAFDLKANGLDLGEKKLDATLAATLDIPR